MSNNKYLFLDAEFGGIGLEKSILSAYFTIVDKEFNTIDSLDLLIKPDDGVYHVTAESLNITKINLIEHDNVAITYKQAGTALYQFLDRNKFEHRLTCVGNGIQGDINHITDKLISCSNWDKFVSKISIDMCGISKFLQFSNKLPSDLSISLDSLRNYFNIQINGKSHNAKVDVLVGIEVFKNLKMLTFDDVFNKIPL